MRLSSGARRLLVAFLVVVVAVVLGGAAVLLVSDLHMTQWNEDMAGPIPRGLAFAMPLFFAFSFVNLVAGTRFPIVRMTLLLLVGCAIAFFTVVIMGLSAWGPLAWWQELLALLFLLVAPLPAVWVVWRRPRDGERRVLDAVVLLASLATLIVVLVPFEGWRLRAMTAGERHLEAVQEFGAPYEHARKLLGTCDALEERLGVEPVLTISHRRGVVTPTANYDRAFFDFDYSTLGGEEGRVTIVLRRYPPAWKDASSEAVRFEPSATRDVVSGYIVHVYEDGVDGRAEVVCPRLEPVPEGSAVLPLSVEEQRDPTP